jgi:hypothetical protein
MRNYIAIYNTRTGVIEASFKDETYDDAMFKALSYMEGVKDATGQEIELSDFYESIPILNYFSGSQAGKLLGVSRQRVSAIAKANGWGEKTVTVGSSSLYAADDVIDYLRKRNRDFIKQE